MNNQHQQHLGGNQLANEQNPSAIGTNTQPGTQPPVSSLVNEAYGHHNHQPSPAMSQSIQNGQGGAPTNHGGLGGHQNNNNYGQNTGIGGAGTGVGGHHQAGMNQNEEYPSYISRSEILHQLRNPSSRGDYYLLVDVRRNDWLGGTINGSLNIPADSLDHSMPTLYELVRRIPLAERDPDASVVVVFYCGKF